VGFVNNGIHKYKLFLAYFGYKLSTEDCYLRNGNYADSYPPSNTLGAS